MFAGKAQSKLESCSIWIGSSLTRKHYYRLTLSSLFAPSINNKRWEKLESPCSWQTFVVQSNLRLGCYLKGALLGALLVNISIT
jgi:hypothetical protein